MPLSQSCEVTPTRPLENWLRIFLENWTRSDEAWAIYPILIGSFRRTSETCQQESTGVILLLLQLLQSKIRREVHRTSQLSAHLDSTRSELVAFLQSSFVPARNSACICLASLSIRCGAIGDLIQSCLDQRTNTTALALLANIPLEVELTDIQTYQVQNELRPFIARVLSGINISLAYEPAEALEALYNWVKVAHVSLFQLLTHDNNHPILTKLLQLLSNNVVADERIITRTSQVLTEALTLSQEEGRSVATAIIFQSISDAGCVTHALHLSTANEWEDACHALASFVCTYVEEEIETLVSQPAEQLLSLLLRIQDHPLHKVRILPLDCWLAVQDIPTAKRHENWKAPLFTKVIKCLMIHAAFPQDIDELDESDFEEFRRMAKDVLLNSFFLLRSSYVQQMVQWFIEGKEYHVLEVSLFGLTCTAREVCAWVQTKRGGTQLRDDQNETGAILLQLLHEIAHKGRHPLVAARSAEFIGAYSTAWASLCQNDAILQLLYFLKEMIVSFQSRRDCFPHSVLVSASLAVRSMLINCGAILVGAALGGSVGFPYFFRSVMEATLSSDSEEAVVAVAEGCTRCLCMVNDENMARLWFADMISPLFERGDAALLVIPLNSSPQSEIENTAVKFLVICLRVLEVLLKFSDSASTCSDALFGKMDSVSKFLDQAGARALQNEILMEKVLLLHEQILRRCPHLVAPNLDSVLMFVMRAFHNSAQTSILLYITSAVEVFGGTRQDLFNSFLTHATELIFSCPHFDAASQPAVVEAYFQLTRRYILYCPVALVQSSQFAFIVSCSVECLSGCQGEHQSTRSALIFLAHLFGWYSLRLSPEVCTVMQNASRAIEKELHRHAGRIVRSGMAILAGGLKCFGLPRQNVLSSYCLLRRTKVNLRVFLLQK